VDARGERAMMNGDGDRERRELARLYAEQDRMMDEAREEAERKELTKRADENGLVYRDREPEPEPDWGGWEAWRSGHEDILRQDIIKALDQEHDAVDKALAQSLKEVYFEIDRRVGTLENENRELRGMLGEALSRLSEARKIAETNAQEQGAAIKKLERAELTRTVRDQTIIERSGRISELMRDNAASRAELARQQFDQAFSQRDARLRTMEEKFAMLLQFLSLQGLDPPKGL
jgi:hypothetical protein